MPYREIGLTKSWGSPGTFSMAERFNATLEVDWVIRGL